MVPVQMTGTLRTDPTQPQPGKTRREFLPLNNKCMELRKVPFKNNACHALKISSCLLLG